MLKNINKIYFFSLLSLIAFLWGGCSSRAYLFTSFHEPASEGLRLLYSYDGYRWKDMNHIFLAPQVGNMKVMRDPSMIQGPDGVFRLVWTSDWKGSNGFGYASSRDLIHWSPEVFLPVMANEPTVVNVWAPELFYNRIDSSYLIVWASTVPYRFKKGNEDELNNHRLYYTSTKDFKNFTPSKLLYDPGFSSIDAQIVQQAPDRYVLVFKDNTRQMRNLKVAFSSSPTGPYGAASASYTEPYTEGPATVNVGHDKWLIYFDAYREKLFGAVMTKDFVHFKDVRSQIRVPEGHKHGTIVPVTRKFLDQLKRQLAGLPLKEINNEKK